MDTAERLGLSEKQEALGRALLADDQLGVVIRAHIYIENELIAFIRGHLPCPEGLTSIGLDYNGRAKLALALGLPKDLQPALSYVGKLRNRFAHRIDVVITEQDAADFEQALGAAKAIVQRSYKSTFEKLDRVDDACFKERSPADKVILFLVTLWAAVAVAAVRAEGLDKS